MTYTQRKAARRQREEKNTSSTGITLVSNAGEFNDMNKVGVGEFVDGQSTKPHQKKKGMTNSEIHPNPLADAGIGAKHVNNVEISHGDADSTWSGGSRQMIIRREVGWSVESGHDPP